MRGVASDIVDVCRYGALSDVVYSLLVVVVVVHVWKATRGKTCRVESLWVGLGAKAREWRLDINMQGTFPRCYVL